MKRMASIFLFCVSVHLALAQWVVQPRVTMANLWNVKFIDRNTGWILGQYDTTVGTNHSYAYKSTILKTTDAGASWVEQIIDNCILYRFDFPSRLVGWAVGITRDRSGLICKTIDGGTSWNVVDSGAVGSIYYSIRFLDDLHGWIGGWNDTTSFVVRTINGGATWERGYDKTLDVNDLFFLDTMNGWSVGENGKIYKTSDGGATWRAVLQAPDPNSPSSGSPLRRIRFTDQMHGCAVGGLGGGETKVWTSDGGVSWNVVNKTPGSSLHGLWFTDANNGWCVGGVNVGLTIQKTSDGGKTWAKQQFPTTLSGKVSYFEDIAFVSPTEGWVVADSGYILKTTNGGEQPASLVVNQLDGAPAAFQLSQNYPNPFNPNTAISFQLSIVGHVSLKMFNALGEEVATLVSEELPAGTYSRTWYASGFPSGVYYYRLQAGSFVETKKLVLLR
jgi:photosystem II stability/assembly factor-like uncharacterized protein